MPVATNMFLTICLKVYLDNVGPFAKHFLKNKKLSLRSQQGNIAKTILMLLKCSSQASNNFRWCQPLNRRRLATRPMKAHFVISRPLKAYCLEMRLIQYVSNHNQL